MKNLLIIPVLLLSLSCNRKEKSSEEAINETLARIKANIEESDSKSKKDSIRNDSIKKAEAIK